MNRTRNLLAVCTLALAGAGLIAGCGGDDGGSDEDPAELLNEALGQDTQYDSGVVNIGIDGTLEGTTSGSVSAEIGGPFNAAEGEQLELQLDADANVSAEGIPGLPGGQISFDFTGGFGIADDSLFVTYQDTTYSASKELFSEISPLLAVAQSAGETTQDPESADALIDSLDNLTNEGTEEINGEETVHVAGDLDFASIADDSAAASGVPFDTSQLEGFTSTIDVFVAEADKSFRQIDINFAADEVEALAASGVEGLDFTLSFGISDPNSEQTIEAPTDTQPLDELLGQLGTSESQILEGLSSAGGLGALGSGLGAGAAGGGIGTPGGAAADPAVQDCVANAKDSDAIVECLNQ